MSKFFIGFLNAAQLAAIHDAGHVVEQFAMTEGQKIVAQLKATSIGATVSADIAALKDKSLSGAQKAEQVVANTAPLILKWATTGGTALVADAEDVARELVQSIYNDTLGAAKEAVETAEKSAASAADAGAQTGTAAAVAEIGSQAEPHTPTA